MSDTDAPDWTTWVIVMLILAAIVISAGTLVVKANERADQGERFKGACWLMGGKVHDDLCVKGNRVVLMRRDVK